MPRFEGIREFLQVVESGSFSKAAEKLDLSNAQVSRLVSKLEDHLGVTLLYRSTRKLSLTDEGKQYYEQCRESYEILESAENQISKKVVDPSGTLKINLAGHFQELFLIPMMVEFMKRYPKIDIDVSFTDQNINLIEEGYDLSICPGELQDSSNIARKIATTRLCICASPEYLEQRGTPKTLSDLSKHNCLVGSDGYWTLYEDQSPKQLAVSGNLRSGNAHAMLSATLQSAGLAHLSVSAILQHLESGALVEVLHEFNQEGVPVWAVYPTRQHSPAKLRVFLEFLEEQLDDSVLDEATRLHLMGR